VSKRKKKNEPQRRASGAGRSVASGEQATDRLVVPLLLAGMVVAIVILFRDFIFSDRMLHGSDVLTSAYYFRVFGSEYLREHLRWPSWNPYIFGGLPFVDAMHSDIFYPTWILRLLVPVARANGYVFCIHIFLSGVATFCFVRSLGVGRTGAAISALAYMFSAGIVSFIFEGHDGRLIVTSMLPVALLFLHRGMAGNGAWNYIVAGGGVGLALLSPQVQMSYYLGIAVSLFFLVELWYRWQRSRDPRKAVSAILLFVAMVGVGLSLAAVQFLPAYSYLEYSPRGGGGRGYEFATSWSMPPEETINLVAPSFSGLLESYWGRNYFKHHSEYLGIITLVLAGTGVALSRRRPYARFFIGLAVFSLIMAWGGHTPLYRIAYYIIPRIKQFRAPSLIFYLFSFSVAVLAGFGLDSLHSETGARAKRLIRGLAIVLGVLAVCLIVCVVAREGVTRSIADGVIPYLRAHYAPEMVQMKVRSLGANYSAFLLSFFRSLVVAGISIVIIWMLVERKILPATGLYLLGPLLLFDLLLVDAKFVRTVQPADEFFAEDEVVRYLKQDDSVFRVFPYDHRPNDDYLMLFGLQSVGGHHGNQLQRYQRFIGGAETVMFYAPNLQYRNFLDLLNVKYIVASKRVPASGLPVAHSGAAFNILTNETVLPRVFIVPDYRVVTDDDALDLLKRSDFDPSATVLLSEDPGFTPVSSDTSVGEALLISYEPDRVVVEATTSSTALLVLSDNYYPMWRAVIDGRPTKIYRAYYTLRAVVVEPGSHAVEFVYDSIYLKVGFVLSLVASLMVLAAGCVVIVQWQRRRRA